MTNESGDIYTVQSFDQFQPQDGWTVVHETDDPVKAVLAARATAYGGFDTRIVKEGRTVWSVFVDACKTGLIDAPAWIDGKFPEWLVLVHDYDLPANEALVMRMPTMSGETWGGGLLQVFINEAKRQEQAWNS